MSVTYLFNRGRVIDCPTLKDDQVLDWDAFRGRKGIKKIVLGHLRGDVTKTPLQVPPLPEGETYASLFPELTHLYLWNIAGVKTLTALPLGLECLDARQCGDLEEVSNLPPALDTLVVSQCGSLTRLPPLSEVSCGLLRDLEVELPTVAATEGWIHHLLSTAPNLEQLNLSGCGQLTNLPEWPLKLRRAWLNRCKNLNAVPDYWPECLTRVELAETAVEELPELLPSIDYVNLAGAARLRSLKKDWRTLAGERSTPRTLFLYRSGLLMPPTSEQGENPTDNVASVTRGYFEDVDLTGHGEVKRCKILMLGNGGAGKTSLSLALQPDRDPTDVDRLGSTHGIMFWDWTCTSKVAGKISRIHRHIWDFGGQEIYHNAHRLFMSAGAVFVVLWNPDQDGQKTPANGAGYVDEWRPLRYWLDFIRLACPHRPRIAVVCSFRASGTDELRRRFKAEAGEDYADCPLHFIDSRTRQGELPALHDWIGKSVVEVVETQGTAVPTYWEIAQNLVEEWVGRLRSDALFAATHRELSKDDFGAKLEVEIKRVAAADTTGRYRKLRDAIKAGTFSVTADRVRRTLAFLTHSGWLFWDPALFGERVIVGQQWALDGIYAALDRRENTAIHQTLRNEWHGEFTREKLEKLTWAHRGYSVDQQRLLISFMERMGICFTLVSERESLWREPVYVSLAHLQTAAERKLTGEFFNHADALMAKRDEIKSPNLHLGRWHSILASLGATYGTTADYAKDAFLLRENTEGQSVLVQATMNPTGIGGVVFVAVVGPKADELRSSLATSIQELLDPEAPRRAVENGDNKSAPAGVRAEQKTVFVSYTWPPRKEGDNELMGGMVPKDYEVPVLALKEALRDDAAIVKLIIDKDTIRPGDEVTGFMSKIKVTDRVLIVHSDKYWRSPYCMFEFWQVLDSFHGRSANMHDTLILLELATSGITDTKTKKGYIMEWEARDTMPSRLEKHCSIERLKAAAIHHLSNTIPGIHDVDGLNRRWREEDRESVIEWIKSKIGLNPRTPRVDE